MLSASYNQNSSQVHRFNLLQNPMNELSSNFGYNYNSKPELFNQYYNNGQYGGFTSQDSKIYSISEAHANGFNTQLEPNHDLDLSILSSRLQSFGIKSRSNSVHNSPFDGRVTPRIFGQSTSNTPIAITNRMGRDTDNMSINPPIMQLFSNGKVPQSSASNINGYNTSRQSPVELIEFQSVASKMGFLVGQDLEEVLNRSATMKNSSSSRISNFFKHKHGSSGDHNIVKQYLVIGVRVPSKEHVSEIVGKEGKKIKMIRQTTGALIATPNEKEDHVFLIEAVPETALKVGQIIQQLADQITRNKLGSLVGAPGERPRSPPLLGNRTPLATASIGVPQRLVGKVIGTQGSIITTVQKETGTEIKSPPKDELRAPEDNADFEISVYENGTVNSAETAWLQIHRAKQLIAHLVMRVWDSQPRNSTPSSDEGHGTGVVTAEWIWPEVARMDDGDAKEIVDRILRSSKAKITPSSSLSTETDTVTTYASEPAATGYHSAHTTPYKLFSATQKYAATYPMMPTDGGEEQSGVADWCGPFQDPRSSYYNDNAFYDHSAAYYYESGYQDAVTDTNWPQYAANQYSDDSRYGDLSYIWRSDEADGSGGGSGGGGPCLAANQSQQRSVPQAVFGTIGDGRKRYSAASNSDD